MMNSWKVLGLRAIGGHLCGCFVFIFVFVFSGNNINTCAFADDGSKNPLFLSRPNNVSFIAGSTAILRCAVMHVTSRYVVWRRQSEPNPISFNQYIYSPDARYNVSRVPREHEWNLIIKDVQPQDSGVYECYVATRKKKMRTVLLRVKAEEYHRNIKKTGESLTQGELPPTNDPMVIMNGTKFVIKGNTISLQCNATGVYLAPTDIDWFHEGDKIMQKLDNRIQIRSFQTLKYLVGELDIMNSKLSDAGVYVCRSTDLELAHMQVHVLDDDPKSTPKITKRGTSNGGSKNNCSSILTGHLTGLLIVLLLLNYVCHSTSKT